MAYAEDPVPYSWRFGEAFSASAAGADEEVLDRQLRADVGDIRIHVHVRGLDQLPGRLTAVPVVRGREIPVYGEVPRQLMPEVAERPDIAEGLEYVLVVMVEI